MTNSKIRDFQNKIVDMTNNTNLPIEVKRLVFSEILNLLERKCSDALFVEKMEADKGDGVSE